MNMNLTKDYKVVVSPSWNLLGQSSDYRVLCIPPLDLVGLGIELAQNLQELNTNRNLNCAFWLQPKSL